MKTPVGDRGARGLVWTEEWIAASAGLLRPTLVVLLALGAVPALAANPGPEPKTAPAAPLEGPPTGDAPAPEAPAPDSPSGRRNYPAADFARFAPRNALDMLRNVPGFQIRTSQDDSRGLGQATDNVIVNGQRLSSKSDSLSDQLARIPADTVVRIDIVDGASLSIPNLTGQVADVITRPDAFSGQFEWSPEFRPLYSHPGYTGASVSVKGALIPGLEYTLSLANAANRGAFGGEYIILDGSGLVSERRDGRLWSDDDQPKITAGLTRTGTSTTANLNASYRRLYNTYREDEARFPAVGSTYDWLLDGRERGYDYELGGDYEFPLAGARLKLVALDRFKHSSFSEQVVQATVDGSDPTGDRFAQLVDSGEVIGRAELGWKRGKADWQLAFEGAFNRLDQDSGLFDLDPSGVFVETPFPEGDGGVREKRYEAVLSYGRPLSKKLTLQLSAGAERSTISQTGPGGLSRSFFRPKGSATLAWTPETGLDLSLKIAREVGQLDFRDFLARVFLDQGNQNGSNAELVPEQSLKVDLEGKKDLGAWGSTDLRLYYRRTEDFVDVVPLPGGGEGRGNIPLVNRYGLESTSTFKFDPVGFAGAKLDAHVILQRSALTDPLTGKTHQLNYLTTRLVELDFRHDIPHSDWAWGAGLQHVHNELYYRLGELGHDYEGPWFDSLFVENKNVLGLTVKAQVINLLGARHRLYRTVYEGLRTTGPILFVEQRNQVIGPIFRFSVKGSF